MKESVDIEFKELDREKGTLPNSVPKEIVAFANTEGGKSILAFEMMEVWLV